MDALAPVHTRCRPGAMHTFRVGSTGGPSQFGVQVQSSAARKQPRTAVPSHVSS